MAQDEASPSKVQEPRIPRFEVRGKPPEDPEDTAPRPTILFNTKPEEENDLPLRGLLAYSMVEALADDIDRDQMLDPPLLLGTPCCHRIAPSGLCGGPAPGYSGSESSARSGGT